MAYLVRLNRNWPGNFRRCVRRDPVSGEQVLQGGEIIGVLEFTPGEVVALSDEELRAVSADIGHCIEHVRLDENGAPRPSEDPYEVPDEPSVDEVKPPFLNVSQAILTALQKAGLSSRAAVEAYIDAGKDLTDLEGIGESSAEKIWTALDT